MLFLVQTILFYSLQKATLNSNFEDIYIRVQLNDSVINLLYFFWTQFFYLPFFVYALYFILCSLLYPNSRINVLVLIALLSFISCYSISNYFALNTSNYVLYNTSSFNLLLSNPINKYHPLLFYLASLTTLLFYTYNPTLVKLFGTNAPNRNSQQIIMLVVVTLVFTLYLGAWWALQEGSWGGWWNWDSSEVFGLIVLTTLLGLAHTKSSRNTLSANYNCISSSTLLLFVYTFVQLNFDIISHNFGIREIGFTNSNNYLPLTIISIVALYTSAILKVKKIIFTSALTLKLKQGQLQKISPPKKLILLTLLFILIILCLPSFYPLINNIFWKCLQLNLFNTLYTEYSILALLWTLAFSFFLRISYTTYFFLATLPYYYLPVLVFNNIKPSRVSVLHFLLIALLTIPFIYNSATFAICLNTLNQKAFTLSNLNYTSNFINFSATSETTFYALNASTDYTTVQSHFNNPNAPQNFLHLEYINSLVQVLNTGWILHPVSINIIEIGSHQANSVFYLPLLYALRNLQLKSKIIS